MSTKSFRLAAMALSASSFMILPVSSYLLFLLLLLPGQSMSRQWLNVTSDSPCVLDANITFTASLEEANDVHKKLTFIFSDDANPQHRVEKETTDKSASVSLAFPAGSYSPGTYTMTVTAAAGRKKLATAATTFAVTKQLNGRIVVSGPEVVEVASDLLVATGSDVNLTVELHDPSGYLKGATIQYFWFVNEVNYGQTNNGTFHYVFKEAMINHIEATVIAYRSSEDEPPSSSHGAAAAAAAAAISNRVGEPALLPPTVKFGVFRARLESRAAVRNSTVVVTGQTWLKHGQLLDLDISCNGSGPWQYCWSIRSSPYNVTGNETCRDPQILTTTCTFPVIWYFRTSGEYDVLLIVSNGVATVRKGVHVTVYDVHKQTPLSFVVVPICSVLAAAVACAAGIFAFVTFKRNMAIETADFDFSSSAPGANSDDEEPKTFWERLRDSMVNAFTASSASYSGGDSVSSVSSVSSHRGHHRPVVAGIQYGSIR